MAEAIEVWVWEKCPAAPAGAIAVQRLGVVDDDERMIRILRRDASGKADYHACFCRDLGWEAWTTKAAAVEARRKRLLQDEQYWADRLYDASQRLDDFDEAFPREPEADDGGKGT